MRVQLKLFDKLAQVPSRAYAKDFGYDCVAVSEEQIAPNVWKYRLGIGLQMIRETEVMEYLFGCEEIPQFLHLETSPLNLAIDFRPRSSVWQHGMVLSNCIGTIDEGYTNEISAIFYHVLPDMPRYKVGDRVGQIMISAAFPMEFEIVKEFDNEQERGLKGYGSSNK